MRTRLKKDFVNYRIKKANETLNEVDLLIRNQYLNTAVNRLYYACFYAVNALLLQNDIQAKSHSGVIKMLGLHFVKTGLISNDFGKFYYDL